MTTAGEIRAALAEKMRPLRTLKGDSEVEKKYQELNAYLEEYYPDNTDEINPDTGDSELASKIKAVLGVVTELSGKIDPKAGDPGLTSKTNAVPGEMSEELNAKNRKEDAWLMFEAVQKPHVLKAYLETLLKEVTPKPKARKETHFSSLVNPSTRLEVERKINQEIDAKLLDVKGLRQELAEEKRNAPLENHQKFELSVLQAERDFHYLNLMKNLIIDIGCCQPGPEKEALEKTKNEAKSLLAKPSKNNLDSLARKGFDKGLIDEFVAAEANVQSHGGARLLSNTSANTTKTPAAEQEKRSRFSRMMSRAKRDNTDPAPAPDHPDNDNKKSRRFSWGKNK